MGRSVSQDRRTAGLARVVGTWLLVVALGASVWAAAPVRTSHSPDTDFSGYRSYAWKTRPGIESDHPLAAGSPLDQRIRRAADEALARRGFEPAGAAAPDFWVVYTGFVEESLSIEGEKRRIAKGVSWIGDPGAHSILAYEKGTLVVEVIDPASQSIVWSGWATDVVDTPEKLRKKAEKTVQRILRHFPPR